jgi:hypothetical protein
MLGDKVIKIVFEAMENFTNDQHIQECGLHTIIKFSNRGYYYLLLFVIFIIIFHLFI